MTTDEQMMLTTDFGRLHAPLRPWLIRQHTSSCEDCPRSVVPRYDVFHQIFPVWRFTGLFWATAFFLTQAGEAKWPVAEFDEKSMMQENGFDFTCPPLVPCGHFTENSPKVSKKRFPWWSIWLRQRAGWRNSLGNTRSLHPVTVINEILQLYSTYTKKAVEEFTQVEMQISTGYMDQLETFLSKFL